LCIQHLTPAYYIACNNIHITTALCTQQSQQIELLVEAHRKLLARHEQLAGSQRELEQVGGQAGG